MVARVDHVIRPWIAPICIPSSGVGGRPCILAPSAMAAFMAERETVIARPSPATVRTNAARIA